LVPSIPAALKPFCKPTACWRPAHLSRQDQETIKLVVSEIAGCDYCVAAHSLLGKMAGLKPETLKQIRAGEPTGDTKRDALVRFVPTYSTTSGTSDEEEFSPSGRPRYTEAAMVDISFGDSRQRSSPNVFNRINDTAIDFPRIV